MAAAYELIWNYSYGAVTIDAICDRAKVKKGSFYYFFESKSDLATAAIEAWWVERQILVRQVFHPDVPPLERLERYLSFAVQNQLDVFDGSGQVLGCPIFTLGSEICNQDERLRALVNEILTTGVQKFEESIRDAQAAGDIPAGNATVKGRLLWAFYEGTLSRARIENNPELLRNLWFDVQELIGVRPVLAATA
jgi:TetR/AcrR family transcriptional repressor of nem operon